MTAAFSAIPFRFFDLHVVRTNRIGPSFVRVTFGGERLTEVESGGRDQRVKLFFPHPHQETPVLPADRDGDWFGQWRAMDPDERAVMRTYTVRAHRQDAGELDIDFAVHGDTGPASRWAATCRQGQRVVVLGPVTGDNLGIDFRPPQGTDWMLLTGDETALPAIEAILSWLPAGTTVRAWLEVASAQDIRGLPTRAEAKITWLVREAGASPVLDAVRAAPLPEGRPYAWLAGESGSVRELRRHLLGQRGFDRDAVTFTGYWRRGKAEDELLAELAND